jgi:hypothetical protein
MSYSEASIELNSEVFLNSRSVEKRDLRDVELMNRRGRRRSLLFSKTKFTLVRENG